MANKCFRCGKGILRGRQVTFSGKRNKRIFKPNLHVFWVVEAGQRVKRKFCTKCLRIVKSLQSKSKLQTLSFAST